MPNVFLISDTHFGHKNIVKFLNDNGSKLRPWNTSEEMDESLIQNWNNVVKPEDKVYHLGDFAMAKDSIAIATRLNGTKVLIRGNHDIFRLRDYIPYFKDIRGSHKLGNLILSHIPVHPDNLPQRWCNGNIHGHMHNRQVMLNNSPDPLYFNVAVERINYIPIALEEIFWLMKIKN